MSKDNLAQKINLQADEEIAMVLRHHPVGYLKQIFIAAFIILLSFFLMYPLFEYFDQIGVALFAALLLTGLIYGAREFFIWRHDVFIITSQRIIDIDQRGFFSKTVSELVYGKILDVSYSVKGFWQTIFKTGVIKIKADGVCLVAPNLKNVPKIHQLILNFMKEENGEKSTPAKEPGLGGGAKKKIAAEFLNQDEMAEYEDYNLQELIEEYKETFGELSLKKLLVEDMEKNEKETEEIDDDVKFTKR